MQLCYSDTTFNFRLKSHAHFSGYDQREQLQAEEMSSLRVESPKWRCVCCWASSGARAPRTRGSVTIPPQLEKQKLCSGAGPSPLPPAPSPASTGPTPRLGRCANTRARTHSVTRACPCTHSACASDTAGRQLKCCSRVSLLPYGSPVGISLPPL